MPINKLTGFVRVLYADGNVDEILTFDDRGNVVTISAENLTAGQAEKLKDKVRLELGGDLEGAVEFDGSELQSILAATVKDNSHNHTIANVTGLQSELNSKVSSVNGRSGDVTLSKDDVNLSNVTNDEQLKKASNLSDVPDKSAAKANLNLEQVASTADFSDMVGFVEEGQLEPSLVDKVNATIPYNVDAATPPTSSDDTSQGWQKGSLWIDNTSKEAYRCVDASLNNAVWINTTLTTSELSDVALTGSYQDLLNKPTKATPSKEGFMSAADKTKLNSVESGSQVNTVDSVNGKTGSVSLTTDDVSEGVSNKYFSDQLARQAISVSGDLSYSNGVVSFNETYSSPSEIKSAYESNPNTNAFTDADKAKLAGAVDSVNGKSGDVSLTTDDVPQGTSNRYFLDAPSDGSQYVRQSGDWKVVNIPKQLDSTDGLSEGSTNLYFTDARAASAAPVQSVEGKTGSVDLGLGYAATADTMGSGKVLLEGSAKKDALSTQPKYLSGSGNETIDLDEVSWGDSVLASSSKIIQSKSFPFSSNFYYIETHRQYSSSAVIQKVWEYKGNKFCWRYLRGGYTPPEWAMEYTTENTSTDPSGFVRQFGNAVALTEDALPTSSVATFSSSDSTTNISSGTNSIPWDVKRITDSNITSQGSKIIVGESGLYRFDVSLAFQSSTARVNPRVRFRINGNVQSSEGLSGYIRAASGHNEVSSTLFGIFDLSSGDEVEVITDSSGSSGSVTLRSGASVLIADKIAGKTFSLTDADTLSGYTASDFAYPNQPEVTSVILTGEFAP